MTYQEYTRLSELIVITMQEMAKEQGVESIVQAHIINHLVAKLNNKDANGADIGVNPSLNAASEQVKKITKVLQQLISKEGILIVTQDSKNKSERLVSLNINTGDAEDDMI